MSLLKPLKRDRPNLKRKRLIKKRDKAFQKDIPPGARCLVPNCPNAPGKHHTVPRRYQAYRWSETHARYLCWPHHNLLEIMPEAEFRRLFGISPDVILNDRPHV